MNKSWRSAWCKKVELSNPADSDTTEEAPHGDYVLHRFGCSQENDQLLREGRQPPYPVYHTGSRHNPWMVGNPYLIALRQSCTSFGSKVPTSSEQNIRTQRVNSLQTGRRKELRIDSVNLAEGGGMAVMARASERITPPNRSVSAK